MQTLLDQIQQIKGATSKLKKLQLLRDYDSPALRQLLFVAFSPTVVLGLGSMEPGAGQFGWEIPELSEVITFTNKLVSREIKGNIAKELAHYLIRRFPETYQWIIAGMLSGELRIGCDIKLLNKAMPGFIPTLDVQLAEEFKPERVVYPQYASTKLDGMRCLAIVTTQGVRLFTRSGKSIECMPHVEAALKTMPLGYYDGELMHPSGFAATMHHCRTKVAKPGSDAVKFNIFDYLLPTEWDHPTTPAKERFAVLETRIVPGEQNPLQLVEHVLIRGNKELLALHKTFVAAGFEGTMIQTPGVYVQGRGKHLMKMKDFFSQEGVVLSIKEGNGKHKGVMGSLHMQMCTSGNEFDLGSGFTDEERALPYDFWVGKTLEFQFQELSAKDGIPRFPTFLRIRPDLQQPLQLPLEQLNWAL